MSRPPDADQAFYAQTLSLVNRLGLPVLVGGAFAFWHYTGIARDTKDLDLFCRAADRDRVLDAFRAAGFRVHVVYPHWLAKVHSDDGHFVDIIHSSGNGICRVDDLWFDRAPLGESVGVAVRIMPPEEMIWQKAFIMERERFDGADVAHLLRARAHELDWGHLIGRFAGHWRVLLSHLVMFGFTYPSERWKIPEEALEELVGRLRIETFGAGGPARVCRGTLLSRSQYLPDISSWGYEDARLKLEGPLTRADVRRWTRPVLEKSPETLPGEAS